MEMYIEQGESRTECELKIASKYNRPFRVIREKKISMGGFLGLFSKQGVQVEFVFSPPLRNSVITANSEGSKFPAPEHGYNHGIPLPANASGMMRHHTDDYRLQTDDLEDAKKKVIAAANGARQAAIENGRETSQAILDSLNELKRQISSGTLSGGAKEEHPAFTRAAELLKLNDFSESYIKGMIEKLRKELPLDKLDDPVLVQDCLLEWIGESISIYEDAAFRKYQVIKPRIMVLVGPTGVGKTTTISKLAAIFGIGTEEIPAIDVRLITIDAFRICAKEQLEQIGNIMQIPVCCVVNKNDLKKEIALRSEDTDLFLIDTIGKSPRDASKLGEMKEILEGAGRGADFHLVISASTKTSDIEVIMRQFEPFDYKSVILTKTDETDHYGNLISALAEKRKSVSFITDGQTVPVDIKRASVVHFLINLEGFKVNREKIDKRFPSGDASQFKWK